MRPEGPLPDARFIHTNRLTTALDKKCGDPYCLCQTPLTPAVVGIDYAREGERDRTVAFDRVSPEGPWKFDQEVTDAFEDMLRRSIPQYDVMRDAVSGIGAAFLKDGFDVVDLGCARGEALDFFVRKFGARNRFVGVDASEPMVEAATRRFEGYIRAGVVRIAKADLRDPEQFPAGRPCLILAVLTLQFVPLEHRQRLLCECRNRLVDGGALVVVEKLGIRGLAQAEIFEKLYREKKRGAGYTDEQIQRKALSLEGVLVPLTDEENLGRLHNAGFRQVECFWRWMQFAGYVAVK